MDVINTCSVIAGGTKIALVVFSLLGFVFFDLVYLAAVINYAAQSELNIKLIYAIRTLIMQRKYEKIDATIQVINTIQVYVHIVVCVYYMYGRLCNLIPVQNHGHYAEILQPVLDNKVLKQGFIQEFLLGGGKP